MRRGGVARLSVALERKFLSGGWDDEGLETGGDAGRRGMGGLDACRAGVDAGGLHRDASNLQSSCCGGHTDRLASVIHRPGRRQQHPDFRCRRSRRSGSAGGRYGGPGRGGLCGRAGRSTVPSRRRLRQPGALCWRGRRRVLGFRRLGAILRFRSGFAVLAPGVRGGRGRRRFCR